MTNEEVMQTLTDMGLHEGGMANWVADNAWWKFANVVAQHEREACARLCEAEADDGTEGEWDGCCLFLANQIRERGQA